MGSIIDEREKRDAIHLAVCPIVAQEELVPGQHVGADGTTNNPVGIVDPFLETSVNPGERFWLVIYPRKISSLRHVWSHPDFPDEDLSSTKEQIEESKRWIEEHFATDIKKVFEAAELFTKTGETTTFWGDNDCYYDEFWHHYQIITGKKIAECKKDKFFTCTC